MSTPDDLQSGLDALVRYGTPMLWQRDDRTWACTLKMSTNSAAAKVEISAKTGHTEAKQAVYDALDQAVRTVNTFEFVVK
jgi:hypothetical protein